VDLLATAYVDKDVHAELLREAPDVGTRRLLGYLAIGGRRDLDTWRTILGRDELLILLGRGSNSDSMKDHFEQFRRETGIVIEIDPHSGHTGKSSVIEKIDWGRHEPLRQRIQTPVTPLCERVQLVDGGQFGEESSERLRESLRSKSEPSNQDARWLLEELNRKSEVFLEVRSAVPALRQSAARLHGVNRVRLLHDLQALLQVEVMPQPFYFPVERTSRIYSTGFNNLSRELRHDLEAMMGWHSFDLRNAQLGIVSRLWNCPVLGELLAKRSSTWETLLKDLGLAQVHKPILKQAVYATIFGAGKSRIAMIFDESEVSDCTRIFLEHPAVLELLEKRDKRLVEIKSKREVTDAYGRRRRLRGKGQGATALVTPRSLLAAEVQSYEMWLLVDPIKQFVESGDVKLVGFLHDGFTLADGKVPVAKIDNELRRGVSRRVEEQGFLTGLA
jgi:hypothetical protein